MNTCKLPPYTLFLFLFASLSLYAQKDKLSITEIFEQSKAVYENNPVFQIQMEYSLFRNIENPVIIEQYEGFLFKRNQDMYLKIHHTELLIVKGEYVKVNHKQKAIEYNKGEIFDLNNNPLKIEQYLSYFSEKEVFDDGNYWRCELSTPKYTQLPYGAITMFFNKETFVMEKQILLMVAPKSIMDEHGQLTEDLKYLKIEVKNFSTTPKTQNKYFDIQEFISHENKAIKTSSKFKEYKLINRTVK